MKIGVMVATSLPGNPLLPEILELFATLDALGLSTAWTSGRFEPLTQLALAATRTSRIELGTDIVQTFTRHPQFLATQALTVQAASGGRLVLGIGVGSRAQMEGTLGFPWHPARHLREYLTCLRGLLAGETVTYAGAEYRVNGFRVPAADAAKAPQVIVAALGDLSLRIAGELADGTTLWLGGPRYLSSFVLPRITGAAREAGRPAPRIVAGVPVCVTSNAAAVREKAAAAFGRYQAQPTYKAILDLEGAANPADVALIGDERTVEAGLRRFADAGATDFAASLFCNTAEETDRTYALLAAWKR